MTLNVDLSRSRALGVRNWTAARLFADGSLGALFVPHPGNLFTDAAGEVPVSAPGQTVGLMRDISGSGRHATQATSAARPTYGRHPASGLRNRIPNNRMDGAVVGVVGSGGALPPDFGILVNAGLATEVVGVGTANALPYIDVRLSGTPSGDNYQLVFSRADKPIPAAVGQTWTSSFWAELVGGDLTNVVDARVRVAEEDGGFLAATNTVFTLGAFARYSATRTLSDAAITNVRNRFWLGLTIGQAVDLTVRIYAPQLEQAAGASAVQITGAGGFDVTEAGQRSVYYLAPDGVDDWMSLDAAFSPSGAYTVAASVARVPGAAQEIFGGGTLIDSRYAVAGGNTLILQAGSSANRRQWFQALESGRGVLLSRVVDAASASLFVNGTDQGSADVTDGVITPVSGLRALFRSSSTYGTGRFYGGVLIDRAITEAERFMLQNYLAAKGGIAL